MCFWLAHLVFFFGAFLVCRMFLRIFSLLPVRIFAFSLFCSWAFLILAACSPGISVCLGASFLGAFFSSYSPFCSDAYFMGASRPENWGVKED